MAKGPISPKGELTQSRVTEILHYNPNSGVFTWRKALSYKTPVGSVAGSYNQHGYILIRIAGRAYRAHRLAWFYITGAWPLLEIDHINGSRDDNRWSNLREATASQNHANRRSAHLNKFRMKGVRFDPRDGRWQSRIQVNGRRISLGRYDTADAAYEAYKLAAATLFKEYACTP